ncbi:TolC family protein [Ramlibacter tataouinensis]|uniref:TolC family protein n=1 Tax=Ramlibacter tataouinensis TaxID=94132 RepID=UPI0022F3F76E|nr:TolC family protein [Ramlibacter tataouinensis]WBY03782.1 TolC family protein [Ramlibacter tataouinensis]
MAAAFLAGCAVTPEPLTAQEQSTQAQADLAAVIGATEPVTAPLTLAEAMARAIRHNLEFKVRQMEAALQARQLDLSRYDMLPRLALSAGYTARDNDAFGLGYQPNGTISTVPSAAVEKSRGTANAALTWNILDFGVSYYRARQGADQVLVMEERRRRALQNLMLDVRLAWWRAEAAQRLLPQIDAMLADIERGADRSRMIEVRRLLPPLQIIAYRRSLLDLQQQLSARRQELAQWRAEFADLVGLRPGENFRVATPEPASSRLPDLITRADDLEAMALERRPELGEERYRERISAVEGRKQRLSVLPSLNLSVGSNYDSNRFLVNNQWNEAGTLLSFNLLKLLSLPAMQRSQEAVEQLDKARRMAVAMAVMTQTRIAVNRYQLLKHELGIWNEALGDDRALVRAMRATQESGLETELELIRAAARLAITQINRDVVHANLEHAMGRVMNSVGYDVVTPDTPVDEAPTLARQLAESLEQFLGRNFSVQALAPMEQVTIGRVAGLPDAAQRDFTEAMRTVLRVIRIPVAEQGGAVRADVAVSLAPPQSSGRPVTLKVTLLGGGGQRVLHTAEMKSMLVEPVTADQWQVLGEAAVFRVADNLRQLLGGGLQAAAAADTLALTEGNTLKLDRRWTGPAPTPATP